MSAGDLQPGDLVLYHLPVSHVALYLGNGLIVHASSYSKPISVGSLTSMPITAMRRVG